MSENQPKNIASINLNVKEVSRVNFNNESNENDEKKKYFTAKYGLHQMGLIRKRLAVENWMFEMIKQLCDNSEEEFDKIDIDLDQILDIDENLSKRKEFIMQRINKPNKKKEVEEFIENLMEKIRTL